MSKKKLCINNQFSYVCTKTPHDLIIVLFFQNVSSEFSHTLTILENQLNEYFYMTNSYTIWQKSLQNIVCSMFMPLFIQVKTILTIVIVFIQT